METFWLCFVLLFIAVDPIGILPLLVSLIEGMDKERLRNVIWQSVITASTVALIFIIFGPVVLKFLGITMADFMIAGSILLLAISLSDLLTGEKKQRQADHESLGAVPIGIPLISGPAVLTTSILLAEIYGTVMTSIALVINIASVGMAYVFSQPITRFLGRTGTKTISKGISLLLAAIAIMLIRRGIVGFIQN